MISLQAQTRIWNASRLSRLAQDPLRAAWWSTFAIFQALSSVVVVRRLLGSFEQPLLAIQILLVSFLATALCILLRNTARIAAHGSWSRTSMLAICGSLTLQAFLLLTAISLSGTAVFGLVASWALFVGAEASWWTHFLDRQGMNNARHTGELPDVTREALPDLTSSLDAEAESDEPWPNGVTQQLTRMRNEHGGEAIFGGVRVEFAPGERQRVVHIGICPPLEKPPQFHFEQSEGTEVNVDVTQCEPFGVRLEVKLPQTSAQVESAVLQFELISTL